MIFIFKYLPALLEGELSRPQLKHLFFFVQVFCARTMQVSSPSSTKTWQDIFNIMRSLAIWKPVSWHTFFSRKCCIYTNKTRGNITVASASEDLLKTVSMGLILQGISASFLWSWMFSIHFIEGWVFYGRSSTTSSCKQVCPCLETRRQTRLHATAFTNLGIWTIINLLRKERKWRLYQSL